MYIYVYIYIYTYIFMYMYREHAYAYTNSSALDTPHKYSQKDLSLLKKPPIYLHTSSTLEYVWKRTNMISYIHIQLENVYINMHTHLV